MKKLIGLTIATLLCLATVSTGAWAYFSEHQASTSNRLIAGSLDLKTNNVDGVTATFNNITSMKPDGNTYTGTVTLRNAGTINAATMSIALNYTESDGAPNSVNMTADQTAGVIEVTALTCGGSDLLSGVGDSQPNTYKDVQDAKNATITVPGGLAAGASKDFVMTIRMRSGTANDFQADGVNISVTFTINQ